MTPHPEPDADALERQIAQALWSQTASTLLGGLVIMAITASLLWGTVDTTDLIAWLVLTGAINAEGWWARRQFPGEQAPVDAVRSWRRRFGVGATVAGLIWGGTLWLLAPQADWPLYLLCVVCATAAFGALMHNAVSFGIIVASAAGTLLPSAAYILVRLDWTGPHVAAAALLVAALVFIVHFAHGHSRLVLASMQLGIDNDRLRQAAERLNAAKTRFLASASHDLRQPMAAVGLLVGLARDNARAPEMRQILEKADESVVAMEALLTGLLDLSRLESGSVVARPQALRLQQIFDAIAVHESPLAARKGLRLRFRPTSAWVVSDPVLLERSVRNLVSNAIRYTERGGVLVGARRRSDGQQLLIEVWDTGMGIPVDDQAAVFDEFVQLGDTTRSQGLGLGLAIVRRSADLLGHRLGLRSVPGRGSCFRMEVPGATSATESAPAPSAALPTDTPPLMGQGIVLVEDDSTVREALAARLRTWGAQVDAFADLPELKAWLEAGSANAVQAPAWVISDCHLPSGSGHDAIALVRAHFASGNAPIAALLMTGDSQPDGLAQAQGLEPAVLQKPFRAEILLGRLQSGAASTTYGTERLASV